jgi:hypothetical protein
VIELTDATKFRTTIGAVGVFLVACVGGTWTIASLLSGIKSEIGGVREENAAIKRDLREIIDHQRNVAESWVLRLAIENPAIRVPDPSDHKVIIGK